MTIPRPMMTLSAIDERLEGRREPKRTYLGISYAGEKCDRRIWLTFRWALTEKKSGRVIRLLRRGQREEAEIIKLLKSVGVVVTNTGRRQALVELSPWVKGHADGIILSGLKESATHKHVLEMKTSNDKAFQELKRLGVQAAKPVHYAQMQLYMLGLKIDRSFYWCVDKDTDEVYTERTYLDRAFATTAAKRVIDLSTERNLPEPMSKLPTWYECKMCPFWRLCHGHAEAEHNCRTCEYAFFTEDGSVFCDKHGKVMSSKAQQAGCPAFKLHYDLEALCN